VGDGQKGSPRRKPESRRRWLAGRSRVVGSLVVAALLVAGALVLVIGGSGSGAGGEATAASASGAGGFTGTVARRTLAERLTASGTIGYAGETTVLARLSGTVTALPKVGDVIRRGGRLYAIDGEPVLLMYGEVPAYRTLTEGVTEGRDVEQLERNLAALGYEPGIVDEDFTSATAAAVRAWQEGLGLEATGQVVLGRVAFLPGPQRVTSLKATLGGGLGGGGGGEAGGESEAPSIAVLRTSSTRRIVSVRLEADQQSVAHRGQKVKVILPGGAEVPGEVRGLTAVEGTAGAGGPGEESEPGVEATVAVTGAHRIPALDGATVNVLFTQRVRRAVLSVPLTALIATGGGRFAVYASPRHGAPRQIVVTPGLGTDGYVEVAGKGLRAGMTVETGR
jgi:peptidoglycan hydrolase-like protein with peptidoglycan-binding domain